MSKKSLPRSKLTTKPVKFGLPIHPLADMFPLLDGKDYADLVEDIRKHGLRQDIDVCGGKIIDGRNRARACIEAGVEPRYHERRFKDDASLSAFIVSQNILRRHLKPVEKRELIAKLLKADPKRSNNATAKLAKTDDKTVATVRADLERRSEIPNVTTRTDTKGRSQPAKKPKSNGTAAPAKKRTRDPHHLLPAIRNEQLGERDAARIETTSLGNETEKKELVLLKRASPEQAEALIKRAEAGEPVSAVAAVAALRHGPPPSEPQPMPAPLAEQPKVADASADGIPDCLRRYSMEEAAASQAMPPKTNGATIPNAPPAKAEPPIMLESVARTAGPESEGEIARLLTTIEEMQTKINLLNIKLNRAEREVRELREKLCARCRALVEELGL